MRNRKITNDLLAKLNHTSNKEKMNYESERKQAITILMYFLKYAALCVLFSLANNVFAINYPKNSAMTIHDKIVKIILPISYTSKLPGGGNII
jgi:hypothetical protein